MAIGYDSAQSQSEEDDLDRWRFAAEIVELIESTPDDWSARIGVFGKWGDGKSTVLSFIKTIVERDKNIVFWFNPWAIQNLNDLWIEFGNRLIEALSDAGLLVESRVKTTLRSIEKRFHSSGVYELGEGAADLLGKSKLYGGALSAIGKWLSPDGPQIRKLRGNLRGKRIVVLIDDLDRANPDLLPKLLLSLRELLDLPGFTFLLAFDNEIVGKVLAQENEAWGEGGSFLDKILDFQYHLPPVSDRGKERLLSKMLQRYSSFIPEDAVQEVKDLIPSNPRKLKSLVRSLAALKPQISRHSADEINWVDIWIAQLIRQESYPFFDRLLFEDTLEREVGTTFALMKRLKKADNENEGILKLISSVGIKDAGQTKILVRLIEAARSRTSTNFRYFCELTIHPHAITWSEFHILVGKWKLNKQSSVLTDWLKKHAEIRSIDLADIEDELFQSLLNARDEQSSLAINSRTVDEHSKYAVEAESLYEMMQQFLQLDGQLTPSRFAGIYEKALHWIGARKNVADLSLREQERQLILCFLANSPEEMSPALVEALKPWDDRSFFPGDNSIVDGLINSLCSECMEILRPRVEKQLFVFLGEPRSIRRIQEANRFQTFKYLMFNTLPWSDPFRNEVLDVFGLGKTDLNTYENANDLLHFMLREGVQPSYVIASPDTIGRLIATPGLCACLWAVITSRQIQWRMQSGTVKIRQFLIDSGIAESDLPLSPELQAWISSQGSGN